MTPEERAWEFGNAAVGHYLARLSDLDRASVAAMELAIREPDPQPPEPCPKCGAQWVPTAHIPEGPYAGWACESQTHPRGFRQSARCELRQLRAAVEANGLMNGDWPVVVGTTVWFWSDVKETICSSRIDSINMDGTVSLEGGWTNRLPGELWHSQAEAEVAIVKGGARE